MSFGQYSDWPLFAVGLDHGQRFGFGRVEHGDGLLDVHQRMQHDIPGMKNTGQTVLDLDVRRAHADDGADVWIEVEARPDHVKTGGKQTASKSGSNLGPLAQRARALRPDDRLWRNPRSSAAA
jgi:hypothetical protein